MDSFVGVCLFVRVGVCDLARARPSSLLSVASTLAIQSSDGCAHTQNGHPIALPRRHIYATGSGHVSNISAHCCLRSRAYRSPTSPSLPSSPTTTIYVTRTLCVLVLLSRAPCLLRLHPPPPRALPSSVCLTARLPLRMTSTSRRN